MPKDSKTTNENALKPGLETYSYFGLEYPDEPHAQAQLYAKMIALGEDFAEFPLIFERLMYLLRNYTFDKDTYRLIVGAGNEQINIYLAVTGPKEAVEVFLEYETLSDDVVAGLIQNRNLIDKSVLRRYTKSDTARNAANIRKIETREGTAGVHKEGS